MGAGEAAPAVRTVSLGRSGPLHPDSDFLKVGASIVKWVLVQIVRFRSCENL